MAARPRRAAAWVHETLSDNHARPGNPTASGASRLAKALYGALRDRALSLPDDEETRAEFVTTRMVETGPGTVKIVNPPGAHDDIVTAVCIVVVDLTSRPDYGGGSIRSAVGRTLPPPARLPLLAAGEAPRTGPRGLPGGPLLLPGGVNVGALAGQCVEAGRCDLRELGRRAGVVGPRCFMLGSARRLAGVRMSAGGAARAE